MVILKVDNVVTKKLGRFRRTQTSRRDLKLRQKDSGEAEVSNATDRRILRGKVVNCISPQLMVCCRSGFLKVKMRSDKWSIVIDCNLSPNGYGGSDLPAHQYKKQRTPLFL